MKKFTLLTALMGLTMAANALVYNVTVPTGTKACYIAGDMTSWAHQEMTKLDDTHYTIDIPSANQTHGYKYSSGPGWEYVEKTAEGQEMGNRTYSANDVVATWAKVYEPGVVIPDIPAGTKLYLKPNANWLSNNARFAVYFFKNTDNTWVDMTLVDASQNIYEVIVPAGTWNTLIFCRMNPNYTENQWNSDAEGTPKYVWNQTANLNYDEINNLYAINESADEWSNGTWSSYEKEEPTAIEETSNTPLFSINGRTLNVAMEEEAEISIYTISGQMIEHTVASNFTREMQQGVYVIRIGSQSQKLVIF